MTEKLELYPYQKEFVKSTRIIYRAGQPVRWLLADETGVGKTPALVRAYSTLEVHDQDRYSAVFVPKTLIYKWQKEFADWAPHIRTVVLDGHSDERLYTLGRVKDEPVVVITNPETLWLLSDYRTDKRNRVYHTGGFFDEYPPYAFAMDEAHLIRNKKNKTTKATFKCEAKHRILITATPMESTADELWSFLHYLSPNPDLFPKSFYSFRKTYCRMGHNGYGETVLGNKNESALRNRLAQFMWRRRKADVLKWLPPKQFEEVPVGWDNYQLKKYRNINSIGIDRDDNGNFLITPIVLAQMTRLKQLAVNPATIRAEDGKARYTDVSPKFEYVIELIKNGDKPLVIYSQFVTAIDLLEKAFQENKLSCVRVTGKETKAALRQHNIDQFNAGKVDAILISDAGGQGVDLQVGGRHLVFLDYPFSRIKFEQILGRIDRPGQQDNMLFTFLTMPKSIDGRLLRLLRDKTVQADRIIPMLIEELVEEGVFIS